MRNLVLLCLLFALFLLPGCADTVPIEALQALSSGTTAISGQVVDASVAKEFFVHQTWQKALETHGKSGVTFNLDKDGRVSSITYTTPPDLSRLPVKPSAHPAWHTLEVVADKGLIAFGIDRITGALAKGWGAAGSTDARVYHGPYNPQGSFNNPGGDLKNDFDMSEMLGE